MITRPFALRSGDRLIQYSSLAQAYQAALLYAIESGEDQYIYIIMTLDGKWIEYKIVKAKVG